MIVEPSRLVFGDAGGEDLGLPGAGRGLEAFELAEDTDLADSGPRARNGGLGESRGGNYD